MQSLLRSIRSASNLALRGAALAFALACLSCSSVSVKSGLVGPVQLGPIETFSWREGESKASSHLDQKIRATIASQLGEMGLREVAPAEADVLVSYWTEIEVRRREHDPYFAHYPAVEFEVGRLTIDLMDPSTGAHLWQGTGQSELRISAALIGLNASKFTPLERERDWRIEEKVAAIIERLRVDTRAAKASRSRTT